MDRQLDEEATRTVLSAVRQQNLASAEARLQEMVARRHRMLEQNDPSLAYMLLGMPEMTPSEIVVGGQPSLAKASAVHKGMISADPRAMRELDMGGDVGSALL